MQLHPGHYAEFQQRRAPAVWMGEAPSAWARYIPDHRIEGLRPTTVTRSELRQICRDPATSTEACFVTCMAWGRMKGSNRQLAWANRHQWVPLVERLRTGGITRGQAYELFAAAAVPGLAAAYFTKLIHFLRPESDGYILDQWTAKSVSLLFEPRFITIRGGWVTRANCALVYERYCEIIDTLAQELTEPAESIEGMLFAGGRPTLPWRRYVRDHWA